MLTLEGQAPTCIIMDAIDECPITSSVPSPREVVLKSLAPLPVSLHDESGQRQDIMEYVRTFVNTDRRMRRWRDDDKDSVIKTLSEKAGGM